MSEEKIVVNEEIEGSTRSLLMGLISQLRMGVEISKVIIPCEFLEPRSLLERLSDLLYHGDYVIGIQDEKDPEERMLRMLKWYLSAWYIRPKGVKKPYNPVLNEVFKCNYEVQDGSIFTYFAEQVSHHPPISGFYAEHPKSGLTAEGYYAPTSHFMGNSGCSSTEGFMRLHVPQHKETYICSWPDVYFRGLLFGSLFMELYGKTKLVCEESGIICEIDFKAKPLFGGEVNEIEVEVKALNGKHLYSLWGKWDDVIYIKNRGKNKKKGEEKRIFLEVLKQKKLPKNIQKLDHQQEFESQILWNKLTLAIKSQDLKAAGEAKSSIEQNQRDRRKALEDQKITPKPKFFEPGDGKFWKFIGKETKEYKSILTKDITNLQQVKLDEEKKDEEKKIEKKENGKK